MRCDAGAQARVTAAAAASSASAAPTGAPAETGPDPTTATEELTMQYLSVTSRFVEKLGSRSDVQVEDSTHGRLPVCGGAPRGGVGRSAEQRVRAARGRAARARAALTHKTQHILISLIYLYFI